MNLIVAADENWAIGNKNELLVRIPADQKFFRETTMGKVVVMGRKTLETFPNGLPLMGRTQQESDLRRRHWPCTGLPGWQWAPQHHTHRKPPGCRSGSAW